MTPSTDEKPKPKASSPDALRKITPMAIQGIQIAPGTNSKPICEWVDPTTLFIEDRYQRDIGKKSVTLVRRIIQGWDWGRMKPPICAKDAAGRLFVVDGQHTAIAAASHPDVDTIPVMVIDLAEVTDRASAFIGHNLDRVAMTSMQLHYASLTAGDEVALAMDAACQKAGCVIRKFPPPNGNYAEGETVAVKALEAMVKRKGVNGGARVLGILKGADRAPISALEIKATFELLYDADWKDQFSDFDLTTIIRSKQPDQWIAVAESKVRKGMKMPLWRAVAIAWFSAVPKKRKTAQ